MANQPIVIVNRVISGYQDHITHTVEHKSNTITNLQFQFFGYHFIGTESNDNVNDFIFIVVITPISKEYCV